MDIGLWGARILTDGLFKELDSTSKALGVGCEG